MSGPLNVQPLGLLSFFDIKNGGRYPTELGEAIIPVLEQRLWLSTQATEIIRLQHAANLSAPGVYNFNDVATGTTAQVPSTEYWYVDRFSGGYLSPVAAGNTFQFSVGIRTTGAAGVQAEFPLSDTVALFQPNGGRPWTYVHEPFIAPPGTSFVYFQQEFSGAGTPSMTGHIKLRRLRA